MKEDGTNPVIVGLLTEWKRLEDAFHDALPSQGETGDPAAGKAMCQFLYDNAPTLRAALEAMPDVVGLREALRLFPEAYDVLTRQEMRDVKGNFRSLIDQQSNALKQMRAALAKWAAQAPNS